MPFEQERLQQEMAHREYELRQQQAIRDRDLAERREMEERERERERARYPATFYGDGQRR